MGNLSKRFLSILIAAVMVFTMIPATVFASGYDVSTMTNQEIVDLVVQLQENGDWDAIVDIESQLDEGRLAAVAALYDAQQETTPGVIAENIAKAKAYKQVDYLTDKVVDAKYFVYLGEAATVDAALTLINNSGANGGLIEITEGTMVVEDCQDLYIANIIVKGAGKDKTFITGDPAKYNNSTNGLVKMTESKGLDPKYKAIFRISGDNVKVMDLTIDAGSCGYASGWLAKTPADLSTVRVNAGTTYFENVVISGKIVRTNLIIGTSSTSSVVHANYTTVNSPNYYIGYGSAIDKKNGQFNSMNSNFGGALLGSYDNLGEGYYKLEYLGVVAYTTIPYAIECYESGNIAASMLTSNLVNSGTPVVQAMTDDLTTIVNAGTPKLLYGYNCAEMRQLAVDFAEALKGLSADTNVDATEYLLQLSAALQIENWHNVDDNGTCAHCGATGLETPAPEVEVEIPSVEEIVPDNATEEEKEVISDVIEDLKQNEAVKDFVPENLAEGSNLSITLTGVEVKGEQTKVPEKITYDVKPVDKDNNVTAPTGKVTFRLPIPASVTKPLASVSHNGVLMGTYKIQGSGNGKYVEVTTDSFSTFTVEMEEAPKATVTTKDPVLLSPVEHDYMCWPKGDDTIDRPLQIVLNFKAEDTLEECLAGKFSKYLVDFYLTLDGLTNGTIVSDGCYLAGNYGSFGWIVIPADELELEERISYPVVSGYDATLNYKDICKSVQDFTAAIYITPALLEANPNMTVTLELRMTNPNDETNVLVVGEPMTYTAAQLLAGLEFLGGYADARDEQIGNIDNVNENTTIDSDAHESVIEQMKNDLSGIYTSEQLEAATTDVIIAFKEMKHETNGAPASVTYSVSPVLKVNNVDYKITEFTAPVTFRLPVYSAESSTQAKVYHEGELMGVYAIQTEGNLKYVEVSSMNFSNFTVEPITTDASYVAQVGGKLYTSLQDAINAANGQTVTLLTDITTDMAVIAAGTVVTLDMAGYDLTAAADHYALDVYGKLILTGTADSVVTGGICINDANSEVVMDTVTVQTLSTDGPGMYNVLNYGGKFTMNSGRLYVAYDADSVLIALWAYGGITAINGGEIVSDDTYNKAGDDAVYAIYASSNANVTISNATVIGAGGAVAANGNATVTVNSGTFTSGLFHSAYGGTGTVVINGGTFNGTLNSNVAVQGGTFNTNVSAFVADGYKLTDNGNGTFGVEVDPAYGKVAKIGDTFYESLQDAINAANGKVVTLIADIELTDTVTVPAGVTMTLELNGHTISQTKEQTSGYQMILNDGNLTIQDSIGGGKISYTDSGKGGEYVSNTITNRGTLTLKSGTIENMSSAAVANAGYPYAIDTSILGAADEVNTIIEGGKVYCESYSALRLRADSETEPVNITITGGEVYGRIEVQNPSSNKATVGELTITGGTIDKNNSSKAIMIFGGGGTAENMTVAISGGSITGPIGYSSYFPIENFDEEIISGGTFSADVSEFVADGYQIVDNDNGTFGVEEKPEVAPPVVDIYNFNVRLQELIKMGYSIYVQNISGEEVLYAGIHVWTKAQYENGEAGTEFVGTLYSTAGEYYFFDSQSGGIPAHLIDTVYVIKPYVVTESGYTYGTAYEKDVLSILKTQYAAGDAQEAIKHVLNYAAAARAYFAIKGEATEVTGEDIFNSILSNEADKDIEAIWNAVKDQMNLEKDAVNDLGTVNAPNKFYVSIHEALTIDLLVYLPNAVKIVYWTENDYKAGNEPSGEMEFSNYSGDFYRGTLHDIFSYNIHQNYYFRAYDADGNYTQVYTMSISAYLYTQITNNAGSTDAEAVALVDLCKAMLVYGYYAATDDSVNKG